MTDVVITSSQTWTCPSWVTAIRVRVVGGGGNGTTGGYDVNGMGGSAGQNILNDFISVIPGAQYSITVGVNTSSSSAFGITAAPGTTGGSGAHTGANGYGSAISALSGAMGLNSSGNPSGFVGSAGGTGYGSGGGGGGLYTGYGSGLYGTPGAGGLGAQGVVIISYITTPGFSADSTSGISPKTVTFTDSTTDTPTAWTWDFGDGNTSTSQNPAHQYTVTGKKTVKLTVSNAYSTAVLTKTDYITIFWKPNAHGTIIQADWLRGAI